MKTILHLDMNSYFATAEQQANPYLRGKPIGVTKAIGRGCVIAASVEAKKFGVRTGTTVWEAKKLCPQIIFVPSDMDKYFSLTKKLMKIAGQYSPTVEVFSIDEFFMDATDTQKLYSGGVFEMVLEMKMKIRESLGEWMKCSVGVSFSKLVAKLASELKKPDGLTFLTEDNYLTDTEKTAVEDVCGIGYARAVYLHGRGAYTLGQARRLPDLPREIEDLVWLRTAGELETVEDLNPAKSVSRTFTTFSMLNTQSAIIKLVRNLVEEAAGKLREMGMGGRTIMLSISGDRDTGLSVRKTIKTPTDDGKVIFDLLWSSFVQKYPNFGGVRQAGVWIYNLMPNTQCTMLKKREGLLRATDKINRKFGLFTIYPAQLLGEELIRPEVTGFLGDKWYRFGRQSDDSGILWGT